MIGNQGGLERKNMYVHDCLDNKLKGKEKNENDGVGI